MAPADTAVGGFGLSPPVSQPGDGGTEELKVLEGFV